MDILTRTRKLKHRIYLHCLRIVLTSLLVAALVPDVLASQPDSFEPHRARIQRWFPGATAVETPNDGGASRRVTRDGAWLGQVLLTRDYAPIPAYSGKPINLLVGFGADGFLRGVEIVDHEEPILAAGVDEAGLLRFTAQYRGLSTNDDVRIGGTAEPGRPVVDGLTGATITAMVINRSVTNAVAQVTEDIDFSKGSAAARAGEAPGNHDPLWRSHWRERIPTLVVLSIGLSVLLLILLFQDYLARHPDLLLRLRTAYLLFTVIFIGGFASAQLTVVNVLTFAQSIRTGFDWGGFLLDPALFLLWSFVAVTLLLWGRGVYCGWLCPFGAVQELLFRLARRLGIREWEPPALIHERLLAVKYLLFLALFGLSLQSLTTALPLAEVEPFKTVFVLHFDRPWPYVLFAVLVLAAGLSVRKAYCRYLCPLGAAMTFPGRFRLFDWLRRRKECGRPCQTCFRECEVRAITPTGEIVDHECHYCLDCQVNYWNPRKCPPLADRLRKAEKHARLATRSPKDGA